VTGWPQEPERREGGTNAARTMAAGAVRLFDRVGAGLHRVGTLQTAGDNPGGVEGGGADPGHVCDSTGRGALVTAEPDSFSFADKEAVRDAGTDQAKHRGPICVKLSAPVFPMIHSLNDTFPILCRR
jgi:hypothetical protein